MTAQSFIDRVRHEIATHEHEGWQLRESASGGLYCAACGRPVDDVEAEKFGKAPLDNTRDQGSQTAR